MEEKPTITIPPLHPDIAALMAEITALIDRAMALDSSLPKDSDEWWYSLDIIHGLQETLSFVDTDRRARAIIRTARPGLLDAAKDQ